MFIKLRNWIIPFKLAGLLVLLYIQLTISFLIGQKRTVNFLAADYTIRFALLTELEQDIEKVPVVENKDSQTQKGQRRWQRSCLLIM